MIRKNGIITLCALLLIAPVLCTGQVAAFPPAKDPGGGGGGGGGDDDGPYFWGNAYGLSYSDQYLLVGAKVTAIYYYFNYYGQRYFCEGDYAYTDENGQYELSLSKDSYPYYVPDFDDGIYIKIEKSGYWTGSNVFHEYRGFTWKCPEDTTVYTYPVQIWTESTHVKRIEYVAGATHETESSGTVLGYYQSHTTSCTVEYGRYVEEPARDLIAREPYRITGEFHYGDLPYPSEPVYDKSWVYGPVGPLEYQSYDGQFGISYTQPSGTTTCYYSDPIQPHTGFHFIYTESESWATGFEIDVSFSIPGSVIHLGALSVSYRAVDAESEGIDLEIYNDDDVTHTYLIVLSGTVAQILVGTP